MERADGVSFLASFLFRPEHGKLGLYDPSALFLACGIEPEGRGSSWSFTVNGYITKIRHPFPLGSFCLDIFRFIRYTSGMIADIKSISLPGDVVFYYTVDANGEVITRGSVLCAILQEVNKPTLYQVDGAWVEDVFTTRNKAKRAMTVSA